MFKYVSIVLLIVLALTSITAVFAQDPNQYESDTFSFAYPDNWQLTESVDLVQLQYDDYRLNLFIGDMPMGLSAGEFSRQKLIGQYALPVDVLTYDSKIKQVMYGRLQSPVTTPLTIILDANPNLLYDDVDIPQAIIDEANLIVSSLSLHDVDANEVDVMSFFSGENDPINAWQSYDHASEPFGFRYPATWILQETDAQIILSNANAQFTITYASIDAEAPIVNPELLLSDNIEPRAAIYGMFQAIPSNSIDPQEDGVAAVVYQSVSTPDNHFTMWITTTDNSPLDTATINEVDSIINTFKTRPPQSTTE